MYAISKLHTFYTNLHKFYTNLLKSVPERGYQKNWYMSPKCLLKIHPPCILARISFEPTLHTISTRPYLKITQILHTCDQICTERWYFDTRHQKIANKFTLQVYITLLEWPLWVNNIITKRTSQNYSNCTNFAQITYFYTNLIKFAPERVLDTRQQTFH